MNSKKELEDERKESNEERTVFIIQTEALEHDEEIRGMISKAGFKIIEQDLLKLSLENATKFIELVNLPESIEETSNETSRSERSTACSIKSSSNTSRSKNQTPLKSAKISTATPEGTPRVDPFMDTEDREDACRALSRGHIAVLLLEKENAIADMILLCGPSNPSYWSEFSESLRAKFSGRAKSALGVRSSKYHWNVRAERDFLFDKKLRRNMNNSNDYLKACDKSEKVSMTSLLEFLFPPNLLHPNSTGRLFIFSLYGPLDDKSRLRSGEKGLHVVTDLELDTMAHRIEREDILAVYTDDALTLDEEQEILTQAEKHIKATPRYTREDIKDMLQNVPRDDKGMLSFHELQKTIMLARHDRVGALIRKVDSGIATASRSKVKRFLTRPLKKNYEIAPPTMFMKNQGMDSAEIAVQTSKLLSNTAFKICNIEKVNSPELTQNIRMVREEIQDPIDRPSWSSNFSNKSMG